MQTLAEQYLSNPVFKLVSETAKELGVRAFVIGGYVRDCFLGKPNKDIDIVVEGSGIQLAEAVARKARTRVSVFKNFGTAMLKYHGIEVESSNSMPYIVIHRGVRKYFMQGYEEIGVFIWICLIIFVSL